MKILKFIFPPVHPEGYVFIAIFALITLSIAAVFPSIWWVGGILTAWCVYFFRNPDRIVPADETVLVCPGDGVVQLITRAPLPKELGREGEERTRISVFLSVFNVHVNRVPATGEITQLFYHPGKFFNADLDKASIHNERQTVVMETEDQKEVVFVQIAGLIARRIVCDLEEGQKVKTGDRFGIIRFGSRVDVYLPEGVEPLVAVGQTVIGGETILADTAGGYEQREAITR